MCYNETMVNEIVKYSNAFNSQALRKFNAVHLDLLMAIASRVRDEGTSKVKFTFQELRELAHLGSYALSNEDFEKRLLQVNERLLMCNSTIRTEKKVIQFALFTVFETNEEEETLTVSVNEPFAFLLNDLTSKFTRFELSEFTNLKSSYAKEFYRRAKQYRSTGTWSVSLKEFRRLLDVPESYGLSHLNERILKPIVTELEPLIHLHVEKTYEKTIGRGRSRLSGFVFTFDSEHYSPSEERKKVSDVTPKPERYKPSEDENTFDLEEFKKSHDGLTPRKWAKRESEKAE